MKKDKHERENGNGDTARLGSVPTESVLVLDEALWCFRTHPLHGFVSNNKRDKGFTKCLWGAIAFFYVSLFFPSLHLFIVCSFFSPPFVVCVFFFSARGQNE